MSKSPVLISTISTTDLVSSGPIFKKRQSKVAGSAALTVFFSRAIEDLKYILISLKHTLPDGK